MATFHSVYSSNSPSISDLDGFTIGRDSFLPMNTFTSADLDDFGFDPPSQKPAAVKDEQLYNPTDLGSWPGFGGDDDIKELSLPVQTYELDRMIVQSLPNATTAISRYGQVTPTRTNSTTSDDNIQNEPARRASARKKKPNQVAEPCPAVSKPGPGRKRKNVKRTNAGSDQACHDSPEEAKRKASLEKNRLAAAKCRVNKKEKTEQLQRDSHEKGLHNAFLKEQVMRMKIEVQHLQAILLAHANCDGCKSPEEIQDHLAALGQEYVANHMLTDAFDDFSNMQMSGMCQRPLAEDYFSSSMSPDEYPAMIPPPLPEFNSSAEFELHTPMNTD
ncbi:hypothetical protein DV737_g682, partial [Chaetothyriales sp. CBS 132003]